MRITKKQLANAIFIAVIAIVFFTPVGFSVKVFVNRLLSVSPKELVVSDQLQLTDYNWKLVGLNGELFDFDTVKGQVILVNFWATWCPPCVAEMPELQKLYTDYNQDVVFVFVAQDEVTKIEDFLNNNEYDFPVFLEKTHSPDLLDSKYLPTTYVIDKKGVIRVSKTGAAAWNDNDVRALLDAMLSE